MEESVRKDGEAAAFELGMHDLHPELQKLMGRLKYRTSYGQNVLNHSKEVAYLAGIMAKEIGLNATVAIRARVPARLRQGDQPRAAKARTWKSASTCSASTAKAKRW